jgi:DNA-binding MarR family transcriptional regulator
MGETGEARGAVGIPATAPATGDVDAPAAAAAREFVELAHALDDWYTALGRQFGPLSRPQRRMLRLLAEERPVRMGDLAERLGLTMAGSTRMLDTLEALGYVGRARLPQTDQRQVFVTLTPAGREALRQADAVFLERVAERACRLGAAERAALARLLRAMSERQGNAS